jgi:hypothetical protein
MAGWRGRVRGLGRVRSLGGPVVLLHLDDGSGRGLEGDRLRLVDGPRYGGLRGGRGRSSRWAGGGRQGMQSRLCGRGRERPDAGHGQSDSGAYGGGEGESDEAARRC